MVTAAELLCPPRLRADLEEAAISEMRLGGSARVKLPPTHILDGFAIFASVKWWRV